MCDEIFKHDFLDGNGKVDAMHHKNGGGIVALSASVHVKAFVGKNAAVSQFSFVGEFGVINGGVINGGEIWGGVIRGGEIWGGEIRGGVIWGGVIRGGEIWGGEIWGGVINGGEINGGVIRGGEINGGEIRGGEIWGGVINGGEIRGGEIWDCAVVKVSPIVLIGGEYTLTAIDCDIKIGCKIANCEWWLRATRKQIDEIENGASKHFKAIKLAVKLIKELQKQG